MRPSVQGRLLRSPAVAPVWRRTLIATLALLALLVAASVPVSYASPGDVTTVAGNGADAAGGNGGQATAASIGKPEGVAWTTAGLFITHNNAHLVRRVDGLGVISTFAGGGGSTPGNGGPATSANLEDTLEGVIRNRNGYTYFSERHRIRSVSPLGIIDTVAGTGSAGYSGDNGSASNAKIDRPHGLAFDLAGGGYLADCNGDRVRKVSALGIITTFAGTGDPGYTGNGGPATSAKLDCPTDVAIDRQGNVYISDRNNDAVRKVSTSGTITTVAGTGTAGYTGDGGAATSAQLRAPHGLALDGADRIFIADTDNNVVRRVDTSGAITTVAGSATPGFAGDGGPASAARFDKPHYLDFDPATGDLYLSDRNNHRVRRIQAIGVPEVPPTVSIDSSPSSPGNDSTPTWTFSISPTQQVVYQCRLTRGATTIYDWADCSSPKTYDLSVQPDGAYTFEVRAVTLAGTGTPSSSTYAYQNAPDPLDRFEIDPVSDQISGQPFTATVRAKTVSGATDTSFNGTVTFSSSGGSVAPSTSTSFVNGVLSQQIRLTGAYAPGTTLTVSGDSGVTGTSNAFLLHDHKYYFKQTTAFTGAGCAGAFAQRDMEEGYAGQDPEEIHRRYSSGAETINFCSPALPAALALPAGSARVRAYVDSTHGSTCDISATLLLNGTTPLGSATRTIPPFASLAQFTWTINTAATTIAAGDTLNLRFQLAPVKACSQTSIHYGGTVSRSHLELLAGSGVPTITADPGPAGSSRSPAWEFTGEAGATFECRLEDSTGAPVGDDWAGCASPHSFDLTGFPDGGYAFAVRQTSGGITSPAVRSDYVLDTATPTAPTIDAAPPSPSGDTTVSWDFSGEEGAAFECRLLKGAVVVSAFASCSASQGYTLVDGDGGYTFEVRQTDAAGNVSIVAASAYELDTSAPAAPSIDSPPPSPGSDLTPSWGFSGETGATFECRLARGGTVVLDWGACSGPATFDLSGEPDGTYTFSVRQIDAAGNVSPAATDDYELDTQAPAAPSIDSGPASPGNDSGPAFGFSGEPGGAFECRLEDGAGTPVPGYDWTACSSPKSYDLSASPDGAYSFAVRQVDEAGGTGPAATRGYVLDTTPPPAPTFTAEPPLAGSATNPSWSFTGVAGAGFECRVERGATTVFGWAACSSPHTLDLSGAPDGLYALSIRATDAAGNTGPAVTDLYSLDRSPPAPPTVTETPGAVGNDSTPSWSFTVEAGALPECRLERGAAAISDWQPCASPAGYDLAAEPDGAYRFLVRARDAAGNAGSSSQSDYVLDRTAPPAPTIDSTPGAVGSSRTPAWGFTGEPGAVHECRLTSAGAVAFDWAPCNDSASYDLAGAPDGPYEFAVRGRDEAGNTGAAADSTYRLDTAGADVTIDAGPGPLGNDASPSWSFSAEPGARFECALGLDGAVVADWAPCASPTGYALAARPDGDYAFRARARDDAENLGVTASYAYTLDRVAPPAPEFTDSPGAIGRDVTPRWELSAEAGATIECRLLLSGSALGAWAPCAGRVSRELSGRGDGDYALVARATDRAANVSAASRSDYRLDATAPDAPEIIEGPGSSGRVRRVSWAFTGEPAAAFECRVVRGVAVLDPWGPCSSPARFSLVESEPGGHVFRVRARDEAGNLGPSTSSDYELLAPLEDVEPRAGDEPRAGGGDASPAPAPAGEATPVAPLVPLDDLPASAAASPSGEERTGARRGPRREREADRDRSSGASPDVALDDEDGNSGPGAGTDRPAAADRESAGERLLEALGDTAAWVGRNLDKTGFPLLLLLVVLGYVAVQNRLDSRDPKLALAPIYADRDLEFLPPPSPNVAFLPGSPTPMTS